MTAGRILLVGACILSAILAILCFKSFEFMPLNEFTSREYWTLLGGEVFFGFCAIGTGIGAAVLHD